MSMTEEKAIDSLRFNRPFAHNELQDAVDVAIQALEEIQAYRAIGLTPSMVKDLIKSCKKHEKNALENAHIVDDYQAIGTIEEFKALKENQRKCEDCAGCTNWRCDCANERAMAIDEFVNALINYQSQDEEYKSFSDVCYEIAEQLKGGAE